MPFTFRTLTAAALAVTLALPAAAGNLATPLVEQEVVQAPPAAAPATATSNVARFALPLLLLGVIAAAIASGGDSNGGGGGGEITL